MIDFAIGLVQASYTTTAGQSGVEVAAGLAALINGDPRFTDAGVTASVLGTQLSLSLGVFTFLDVGDAGLVVTALAMAPSLPSLSPGGMALLVVGIASLALWRLPRRASRRR